MSTMDTLHESNDLGERIAMLRKAQGIVKKEFSEKAGVQRTHLHAIETGKKPLTLSVALSLSDTYNVSLDWLVRGYGSMEQEEVCPHNARLDDDAVVAAAVILTLNDIKRLGRNPTGPLIAALFREHLDNSAKEGARYDADELIARISSDVNP